MISLEMALPIIKKELKKSGAKSVVFSLEENEKGFDLQEKKYNANTMLFSFEKFLAENENAKKEFTLFHEKFLRENGK